MTFKDFLINYFSPIFFISRCFLSWIALCLYFILPLALSDFGIDRSLSRYIGIISSMYILYKALKPWRVGMTIGEAMEKYKKYIK